jgi:hypothetical protein
MATLTGTREVGVYNLMHKRLIELTTKYDF